MSHSHDSVFIRAYPPSNPAPGPAIYLPFQGSELVVQILGGEDDSELYQMPSVALLRQPIDDKREGSPLYLGTLDDIPCLAYRLPADMTLPEGCKAVGIRSLYGRLDDDSYALAGYASQMLHWWEDHLYCSYCRGMLAGLAERGRESTWGKVCEKCDRPVYPPVNPAILLLIHDGADQTLMVTKPGWGKRFSIVAGFVEPGESLEECCIREAKEEVGVEITDVAYFGSQPWPFPHQVMIGFTARYNGGEIQIDATELADGRWFRYDAMPELPPPLSLSRQIIDAWVEGREEGEVNLTP
ncbi:MAG: NAD(+) diphosphatase [Armatimonadaceae bacterium]